MTVRVAVRPVRLRARPDPAPSGMGSGDALAVVVVRHGRLPAGAREAVAEAGGLALLVGSGTEVAASPLGAVGAWAAELGDYAPGSWATALAPMVAGYRIVLLPASPDGRDLAPRLAFALGRPLHAGAHRVCAGRVELARHGGLVTETRVIDRPCVATLLPGRPGTPGGAGAAAVVVAPGAAAALDASVVAVVAADAEPAEARRLIAAGPELGRSPAAADLVEVATALGATTDSAAARRRHRGAWATAGPELCLAVGFAGHLDRAERADHVVAVDSDPSTPAMASADLAVVTDGAALVAELALRLGGSQ